MPKPLSLAEHAMESQSRIREVRRESAPLFSAALASGNHSAMAEAHALAVTLRTAERQAKRIAGLADGVLAATDGLWDAA